MTTRELRRLSRRKLLQLLIDQMEENKQLHRQLQERDLVYEKAGTLAEAALQLGGVFEAADRAAQIYMEHIGGDIYI